MKIAAEYRLKAEDAERSAKTARTERERTSYLAVAEVWREFTVRRIAAANAEGITHQ